MALKANSKLFLPLRMNFLEGQLENEYINVCRANYDEDWEYPTILVVPDDTGCNMYIPHFIQGFRVLCLPEEWKE